MHHNMDLVEEGGNNMDLLFQAIPDLGWVFIIYAIIAWIKGSW